MVGVGSLEGLDSPNMDKIYTYISLRFTYQKNNVCGEKVCMSKKVKGLGVKRLSLLNRALLCK